MFLLNSFKQKNLSKFNLHNIFSKSITVPIYDFQVSFKITLYFSMLSVSNLKIQLYFPTTKTNNMYL